MFHFLNNKIGLFFLWRIFLLWRPNLSSVVKIRVSSRISIDQSPRRSSYSLYVIFLVASSNVYFSGAAAHCLAGELGSPGSTPSKAHSMAFSYSRRIWASKDVVGIIAASAYGEKIGTIFPCYVSFLLNIGLRQIFEASFNLAHCIWSCRPIWAELTKVQISQPSSLSYLIILLCHSLPKSWWDSSCY